MNLNRCDICPRICMVDRANGKVGYCKMSDRVKIARCDLHFWEEPCISGENGSGTIFFSGCNLGCVFCQNYDISTKLMGKEITIDKLASLYQDLEDMGANNINLVTPTHFAPQIIESFKIYKPKIPIVYNSSGYESIETLKRLEQYIDIYLPDMKYSNNDVGQKYSNVKNYFDIAQSAILEMIRQKGTPIYDENGIIQSGVIIRHLILPSNTKNSIGVIEWLKENAPNIPISLMAQYIPYGNAEQFKEINRRITQREYEKVCDYLFESGLDGFVQERSSAKCKFIPKWYNE